MKSLFFFLFSILTGFAAFAQPKPTYCNPLNLDYAYIPSLHTYYGRDESHRSTADPAVVNYKDTLYLFSTNQQGYWWSVNLAEWHYIRHDFRINRSNDNVCAPGAWAWGDTLLFMPSHMDGDRMPIYLSTNPKAGEWTALVDSFPQRHAWDPSFFRDDDGRVYLYWGASNTFPPYAVELDRKRNFTPTGPVKELFTLHPDQHGWERFGQDHTDTTIAPYMEGVWMNKHKGKYYLQYAAPGTEFNIYADGVYLSDHPMGPFEYAPYNPMSYKPGGFITGAGHGSTFADAHGNYWHIASITSWIKYKFERRLGVWPAGFDADGQMYCNTAFGDYPQYLPKGPRDHRESAFTGWMLLSYGKKSWASSTLPGKNTSEANDENIRSYWSAASGDDGEFWAVDLGEVSSVHAVQINFADEDVHLYDKQPGIYHQYQVLHSLDGKNWSVLIDKRQNRSDVPHDYVALPKAVKTRYLKMVNHHMAAGKFALSGFRVFGKGTGKRPGKVKGFTAERRKDRREVSLRWEPVEGAYAYQVYFGIQPDKLYNCMMVIGEHQLEWRGMNVDQPYYFQVEALGESGVGKRSATVSFRCQMPDARCQMPDTRRETREAESFKRIASVRQRRTGRAGIISSTTPLAWQAL